jgi:hypothetical protein
MKDKKKKDRGKLLDEETGKLRTPVFRAAFCYIEKPKVRGEKKTWEVTGLFDKKKTNLKLLREMVDKAIESKWGANPPKNLMLPFKDAAEKEGEYDGWEEGLTACRFWNKKSIKHLFDEERDETDDLEEFYSGGYYKAVVKAFAWDNKEGGKKGVSFDLLGMQKIADGERLGVGSEKVDSSDWD